MKNILKALVLGALPAFVPLAIAAENATLPAATQPATQPATAPSPKAVAQDETPLTIPDGTTGPANPVPMRGGPGGLGGARR